MWELAALPMLPLCMRPEHLSPYLKGFGCVIAIYAIGLIAQELLHVTYTNDDAHGTAGRSWPILVPNNGAAFIYAALIPAFWLSITKGRSYALLFVILLESLLITHSKAEFIAAGISCITGVLSLRLVVHAVCWLCLYAAIAATFTYAPASSLILPNR